MPDLSPTGSVQWDNLPDAPAFSPLDKIWMRSLTGQGVMLNLVTLEPGAEVPLHSHANEQAGYVLRGTLITATAFLRLFATLQVRRLSATVKVLARRFFS